MKNTVKSSAYFAAYPLKAVEKAMRQPDLSQQSPYLQSLLTGQRKNNEEPARVSHASSLPGANAAAD